MTNNSIPRQLLTFMLVTAAVVLVSSITFLVILRAACRESGRAAENGIADAARGFTLLDEVGRSLSALQTTLRLSDPDQIETAVAALGANGERVMALMGAEGQAGATTAMTVVQQFEGLVGGRRIHEDARPAQVIVAAPPKPGAKVIPLRKAASPPTRTAMALDARRERA